MISQNWRDRKGLNTLNGDHAIESTHPDPVATITFGEAGCAYDGPTSLPAELVAVSLDNPTTAPWGVALVSIGEGHTYAELGAFLAGSPPSDEPPPWMGLVSIGEATPATQTLVAWSLERSSYGVICAIDDGSTIRRCGAGGGMTRTRGNTSADRSPIGVTIQR